MEYHGRQIQSVRFYYVVLYPIGIKFPSIVWYFIIFMITSYSWGIPNSDGYVSPIPIGDSPSRLWSFRPNR